MASALLQQVLDMVPQEAKKKAAEAVWATANALDEALKGESEPWAQAIRQQVDQARATADQQAAQNFYAAAERMTTGRGDLPFEEADRWPERKKTYQLELTDVELALLRELLTQGENIALEMTNLSTPEFRDEYLSLSNKVDEAYIRA